MIIDLEDKRIKIAVTLVAIVGFATYYFYPKDEYVMEMVIIPQNVKTTFSKSLFS